MDEWARLENEYIGNGIVSSNLTSSAERDFGRKYNLIRLSIQHIHRVLTN